MRPGIGRAVESWSVRLAEGDAEGAWELFIDRYRPLIVATIRRTIDDDDSAHDVFADVCGTLSEHDLRRLRSYADRPEPRARFSTWLVTVVHHLVIDWLRKRDGRRRVRPPAALTGVQREIFRRIFAERRSHVEAYELVSAAAPGTLSFSSFLKELAETYRVVQRRQPGGVMRYMPGAPAPEYPTGGDADAALAAATGVARIADLIDSLPADERLALQLSVIEELPAADVARMVGWANAKAVYNRVHRLLARLRAACERQGIRLTDL